MPNVLSPRDLVSRFGNMDETVLHIKCHFPWFVSMVIYYITYWIYQYDGLSQNVRNQFEKMSLNKLHIKRMKLTFLQHMAQ